MTCMNKNIKMDVITSNFQTLIQRVINKKNQNLDNTAVEIFCLMVIKEPEGIQIASKLLASWIHSNVEWQVLQTLTLLDTCMKRCGPLFNSEIGKFRFLNEMIKLVSPKYLGNSTPISIREKVLNLLEAWTISYPSEAKIKEAFEMLRKQGVVKNEYFFNKNSLEKKNKHMKIKSPIFDDEEKSKLLQKLLQSKNPNDLQTANKLIKTMVKEDEKRIQQDTYRIMELEFIHNNVKLLSDMLDYYTPVKNVREDIDLMKELYQTCKGLQSTTERLIQETQNNAIMLVEIVDASKDLENILNKYETVFLINQSHQTLLDLAIPNLPTCESNFSIAEKDVNLMSNSQSDLELLENIFGNLNNTAEKFCISDQSTELSTISIMQPLNIADPKKIDSKNKVFEHFNELGEFFLKKNSSDFKIKEHFDKTSKDTSKISLNSLIKQSEFKLTEKKNINNYKSDESKHIAFNSNPKGANDENALANINVIATSKENLDKINQINNGNQEKWNNTHLMDVQNEFAIKSLSDIEISLETITPGNISPITVIDNKNGLTVILHFAKDNPRPDVSIIVITTISKNSKPLKNYLFQAVVPKKCKCRLQLPSETELLAYNPFLPPSAITQIMLIANPHKVMISLKFMLSYIMDKETITEIGEVDKLPII